MIVKIALLAALLSEPAVDPKLLDMQYKPCVQMYSDYIEVSKVDMIKGKLMGANLKYLCTPINPPISNEEM
jgi:hypothetical protein